MRGETRRAFRDNGLNKMTDSEFELYVKDLAKTCLARGDIKLRQQYTESIMLLSYEETRDTVNIELEENNIEDIFRYARKISIKAHEEIKRLEEEFNKELEEEMKLSIH